MESIWNRNIPWIPHGFHMEWKYSMESTWIPYGMEIFHGVHMESTWNEDLENRI
jgi:hypothetical protein